MFDRVVYKITNLINGKIYIGQDCYNRPGYMGGGKIIKLAIAKYGIENFKKEILKYCSTQEETDIVEKQMIQKYNSRNKKIGYNLLPGGKGNGYYEYIKNMSESLKGDKNPMFGKSVYDVWVEKYGKEKADKLQKSANEKRSKNGIGKGGKSVEQYDKDWNFIASYKTMSDASLKTGANINVIRSACRDPKKTAGGYRWKLKKK